MARTAVLGLPRVGPDRELKHALESYWAGRAGEPELRETAAGLRAAGWRRARSAGIDVVPSGDQSLYDHVLDAAWGLSAVPERFGGPGAEGLDAYFAMARGSAAAAPARDDQVARHQLPLPRPGARRGPGLPRPARPLGRADRAGAAARHRHPARRPRPVQLPAAVEGARPSAGGPRRARAGLRGAAGGHGRGRRPRGPDRRAVPRAGPDRRGARRGRGRPRRPGGGRRPGHRPGDLLRAPRARDPRAARGPAAGRAAPRPGPRPGAARAGARGRSAARRSASRWAWSTAATCGPPTSTPRSATSTRPPRRSAATG